ncbi:MAG TPA: chemotaxis protein CheA [Gelria sp.]|nr:chemotaxis protein CheA [Gelria sp.]
MDMSQYLDVFLEESKEHLGSLNQRLIELEKDPGNIEALNEIFRAAHTLKGMSSTMGFDDLADLTHHMENVLSDLKEGILPVNSAVIDIIFQCFDRLQMIIDQIEVNGSGTMDNSELISILENIKAGDFEAAATIEQEISTPGTYQESFTFNEYDITVLKEAVSQNYNIYNIKVVIEQNCLMKSVRAFMVFKAVEEDGEVIKSLPSAQDLDEGKFDNDFEIILISTATVDDLEKRLGNISEINTIHIQEININELSSKPVITNKVNNIMSSSDTMDSPRKVKQTVRVDIDRLDNLMNLVGELVMHKGRLEQIGSSNKIGELNETIEQIDRISTDLQAVVMKVRMVPIEQVFNRFPRMVRDLARDLDKEVEFLIEGKETELDRTVIDEIGDPLVHLLRNAIDHGLETSQERLKKGKPQQGTVILRARHEGNNVFIEVDDDGGGIDTEQVIARAVEKGIITDRDAEQLSREEAIELLFDSGFSTARNVTDISGRGVGLDVVKTKIESLSGEIFVDSKPGQGTRFTIKLPLTLAIIQALMVSVCDEIYAIPLSSVDETTMITASDIKMVQNQEVIMLRGSVLPLYRLGELLLISGQSDTDEMYVVVVRKAEKQIGLVVDSLIGQQEIVIKSLGRLLGGIPGLAGAIVAGDGHVRLILDIITLF